MPPFLYQLTLPNFPVKCANFDPSYNVTNLAPWGATNPYPKLDTTSANLLQYWPLFTGRLGFPCSLHYSLYDWLPRSTQYDCGV